MERDFTAAGPNRLWLADLTYVKTHSGWVYVAFIIDAYSGFVVGWQAARSLRSGLAIDALEMAIFNRQRGRRRPRRTHPPQRSRHPSRIQSVVATLACWRERRVFVEGFGGCAPAKHWNFPRNRGGFG